MTKKEIIKHLRDKTDWNLTITECVESIPELNELIIKGAIMHDIYFRGSLIPQGKPNLSIQRRTFSLVDGFDYSEYE